MPQHWLPKIDHMISFATDKAQQGLSLGYIAKSQSLSQPVRHLRLSGRNLLAVPARAKTLQENNLLDDLQIPQSVLSFKCTLKGPQDGVIANNFT